MRGVDSSMAALRRDIRSKAGCCVALGWAAGMAAVGIDCGRRRGLLAACLLACFVLRHVYRDLTMAVSSRFAASPRPTMARRTPPARANASGGTARRCWHGSSRVEARYA